VSLDKFGGAFTVKTVDVGQRVIAGWAAYHNNIDRVDDIIEPAASVKAVARLKSPADVGVFIGHDLSRLPVGVPVKIEAHPEGLYVETRIFEGPTGDDLLGAARGLKAAGGSLGMSIGYRLHDGRRDRVNGKTIRRITDYSLHEYSFAASQAIANPSALVTGVKIGDAMYRVEKQGDRFHVMKDEKSIASYATEDEAAEKVEALKKPSDGKTHPNSLPDSAFLYVAPGGQLDDESKTVPRSLRHFPYRDADGALDMDALAAALPLIREAKTVGLDTADLSRLYARARHMLDQHERGAKTVEDISSSVSLDLLSVAYGLIDAADRVVTEHKALAVIGESTNEGRRMRPEMRESIAGASEQLALIVQRAEMIERGEEGKALTDWWAAQFDLLEVAS
jgi:HK97 family phage prohead protease